MENISISDLNLLIFVLPGFVVVWTFRFFTNSDKNSGFEYLALSFVWGLFLLVIIDLLLKLGAYFVSENGGLEKILQNPYSAAMILSVFAVLVGYVGSLFKKNVSGLKKFLNYKMEVDRWVLNTLIFVILGLVLLLILAIEERAFMSSISFGDIVTALILVVGLIIAKREADNALRPYVDVGVIFEKGYGTRFQFLQRSKIPALVWIDINIKIDDSFVAADKKKCWLDNDERLCGEKPWAVRLDNRATSAYALKKITEHVLGSKDGKVELFVNVSVAPIFRKESRFNYEEKHYIFNKDEDNPRWIEAGWGIEDLLYPGFVFNKKNNA